MIKKFVDFFETYYRSALMKSKSKGKKHVIIDFRKVIKHDPSLGDYILDEPNESIKAMEVAAKQVEDDLSLDFTIRFINVSKSAQKPINKIRSKDISKFMVVEGMVKRKADVRAQITSCRFECPACSTIIPILQLDEKRFKEPSTCGCGRRKGFKILSKHEVDVFSLSLEEPTETLTGGTKLSQLKILCRTSLTDPKIERMVYQGVRCEIAGELKEIHVRGPNGQLTSKIDWYLEANYIKVFDESFVNIKWTKEEEEEFVKLSKSKKWLTELRESIFYDVHGYEEECEGVILQMFSGVGKDREGARVRGNFHILLIGDPGGAKSTILKIAQRFAPKAMYVAGTGVTGAGLTGAVVRDELLGGYTLEAGSMVLCNNGLICIDELDKVGDEFKKALHEPLEQETISISKAGIQATMVAQTSVLAAANPKHGSYSDYSTLYEQMDLSTTLINRFDLVYPIKESKQTTKDDYDIAMKILSRGGKTEKIEPKYSREFIKKYIAYSKTIMPEMPLEIQKYIASQYQKLKEIKRRMSLEGKDAVPITARNVDGIRRVIEAVAKSRLHEVITKEDAEIGYEKLIYSIQQIGIDPDSGNVIEESIGGKCMKKKDLFARILTIIKETAGKDREPVTAESIIAILSNEGFDDELKIEQAIETLKKNGDIFEPRNGSYLKG